MTCGDKFNRNCPTGGSQVDPAEVDGRATCSYPGCDKKLRGDGKCVDGHVQERSVAEQAPLALARQLLREQPPYQGKAYRVATGYRHAAGTTAADVVRFEQEELGNDNGVDQRLLPALAELPAEALVWVCRGKQAATRYGSRSAVQEVALAPGAVEIGTDGDGGYWVVSPPVGGVARSDDGALPPSGTIPSGFARAVRAGTGNTVEPLGGKTKAQLRDYGVAGAGVWKAMRGDYRGGRYNHDGHSEVAAYCLVRLLGGTDVVPETVFDQEGTVQRFVPDAFLPWAIPRKRGKPSAVELPPRPPAEWNMYDLLHAQEERVYTLLALDIIADNWDRHEGNFLFDPIGDVYGIDHGHATWDRWDDENNVEHGPLANSYLLMYFWGKFAGRPRTVLRHGQLQFPPALVARWRAITRAQFDAACAPVTAQDAQLGVVNLDNAWANLQYIVARDGLVTW